MQPIFLPRRVAHHVQRLALAQFGAGGDRQPAVDSLDNKILVVGKECRAVGRADRIQLALLVPGVLDRRRFKQRLSAPHQIGAFGL